VIFKGSQLFLPTLYLSSVCGDPVTSVIGYTLGLQSQCIFWCGQPSPMHNCKLEGRALDGILFGYKVKFWSVSWLRLFKRYRSRPASSRQFWVMEGSVVTVGNRATLPSIFMENEYERNSSGNLEKSCPIQILIDPSFFTGQSHLRLRNPKSNDRARTKLNSHEDSANSTFISIRSTPSYGTPGTSRLVDKKRAFYH